MTAVRAAASRAVAGSRPPNRLGALTERVAALEMAARLPSTVAPEPRAAGDAGLSPAGRLSAVLDPDGPWLDIGALRDHDLLDPIERGSGMVTVVGTVAGRPVVLAASVPAVAGGALGRGAIARLLRAQEIALRQRLPIGYLLEGTGVASPEDGFLPGSYGAGRVLALAARLRATGVTQVGGRVGPLGGALGLLAEMTGRPVTIDRGGLAAVRTALGAAPAEPRLSAALRPGRAPAVAASEVDGLLPSDHRRSYDMMAILGSILDAGQLEEFQPRVAAEMICGHGWIEGIPVAVIANRRGLVPVPGSPPRVGGIIYAESASKTGFFIETASRQGIPILFVQDVSGFMLGVEAEHSGIIRAGAGLVEAMATARSPRITLTVNHASGAGYYAMASQGFEPDFALSWPTGRIGAMEAEAAINAVHGTSLAKQGGLDAATDAVKASIAAIRATYEQDLEAVHAAARGHVDAIVTPERTRAVLAFLLQVTARPA